jgi:hypothetical protein
LRDPRVPLGSKQQPSSMALGRGRAQLGGRAALLALVLFAASASAYDAAAAAAKSDTTCSESQCQNGGAGYGCDANKRCCCTDLVIAALAAGGVTATNRGVRKAGGARKRMRGSRSVRCRA